MIKQQQMTVQELDQVAGGIDVGPIGRNIHSGPIKGGQSMSSSQPVI